jgi:aspartate/methionine/tyrosine aminotransferase
MGIRWRTVKPQNRKAFVKNSKNYVMISPATLTQSGLLAVLLQRQHRTVIESARRRTRREHLRAIF